MVAKTSRSFLGVLVARITINTGGYFGGPLDGKHPHIGPCINYMSFGLVSVVMFS